MRRIHRWPVNSPHKGPVTRKIPFDDVITCFVYKVLFLAENPGLLLVCTFWWVSLQAIGWYVTHHFQMDLRDRRLIHISVRHVASPDYVFPFNLTYYVYRANKSEFYVSSQHYGRSVNLAGYSILDIGHSNVQCPISNIRLTSRSSLRRCYFSATACQITDNITMFTFNTCVNISWLQVLIYYEHHMSMQWFTVIK